MKALTICEVKPIYEEFIVAGCDVGVSDIDKNTGFVLVRITPGKSGGKVEVLEYKNFNHREALREIPKIVNDSKVEYIVIDAPLLPDIARPTNSTRFFRPNESLISPCKPGNLKQGLELHPVNERIAEGRFYSIMQRMQAQSTWRKDNNLSPFAAKGNEIKDALIGNGYQLITSGPELKRKGVIEGFPKAFYWPLVPPLESLPKFEDSNMFEHVDSGVLRWLLDPSHVERFWERAGFEIDLSINARSVLINDHVVCGLSMAINGIMYGLGKASLLCCKKDNFDYGAILMPHTSLFQEWAKHWLDGKLGYGSFDIYDNV
jgi:hypothetical protein